MKFYDKLKPGGYLFVNSGILNDTKERNGYFIYVNEELAGTLAGDSFRVTAYTRLNTDAISSTCILDFAYKAIHETGIEEGQVNLTEYFAVMSGAITSGIPLPVPLLVIVTAILAATIIYRVFYNKITKNVQMFSQLRTIGMTRRQMKKVAGKEGVNMLWRGFLLGSLPMLMPGLSGEVLIVTSTIAGSIDPEKQASFKYYPAGDIYMQVKNTVGSSFDKESEPYGSSKLQLEENPLEDEELLQEIGQINGIDNITSSDCVNMTIIFPGGNGSITSITDLFSTLRQEQMEEKQAVLSDGTVDYDDMVERNGILVTDDTSKVGDILKIEGKASDGNTFDVEAVVVGTYDRSDLMEVSPAIPGSPYFIMAYDTAKKLEQTGILAIKTSDGCFDEVLAAVQEIADRNKK